jgi:integrin alpha FG-GAP repeat containing protein 1
MEASYKDGTFLSANLEIQQNLDCSPINPHSNAFVDLDGDCLAGFSPIDVDLLITCKKDNDLYFQVYINKKNLGFVFQQETKLPEGSGQISFADMNSDGTIDLVFPSCKGSNCFLHILYNIQIPLCSTSIMDNCRNVNELCISDPNFKLDLSNASVRLYLTVGLCCFYTGSIRTFES